MDSPRVFQEEFRETRLLEGFLGGGGSPRVRVM